MMHIDCLVVPNSVIGSFNGGKDACVVLELQRAAHAHYYYSSSSSSLHGDVNKTRYRRIPRPRVVYWDKKKGEFIQITNFVQDIVQRYMIWI